ncbi:exported hypothetical protein [Vibrio nigripulchritudo SFn118]|nr:exported hypothetical protein [Vibrio nigripulchritudo SFn118]
MKCCLFLLFLTLFSYSVYSEVNSRGEKYFYPELYSSSWSPDLSYEDIRNIRVGISEISSEYGDHGYALGLLAPYIKDKR